MDEVASLGGGRPLLDLIRNFDWSRTSLGARRDWPSAVRTVVQLLLSSRIPMVSLWGADGVLIYNEGYAEVCGPRHPTAMGGKLLEQWPEAAEFNAEVLRRGLAGEASSFRELPLVLHRHGHAEQVWMDLDYTPVRDERGKVIGVLAFVLDSTARKLREDQLRSDNQALEGQVQEGAAEIAHLWNASPDLMVVMDADGVYQRANPSWTRILGYDLREIIDRPWGPLVHPDDLESTRTAMDVVRVTTLPMFENRLRHKDGGYRWISWSAARHGEVTFAIGRDVTEARASEATLRATEEQLRQSQKLEAVGQLTGGVAHDFNNLLTVIRGSVDLLRRPGLSEDRRRRYLDAVADTADRASRLTSQLLAFARRQALRPETFEVGARLRDLDEMLRATVGGRVRLSLELAGAPCFVDADANQFDTAIVNMAVNARDAMEGGGALIIRLACASTLPPIRGHAGSAADFVAISVVDTGSGIDPEHLPRIFEPFYTTKSVGKGTGLGLSQVFGFAKQSGGDVDVESQPGEGATFILYLPQSAEAAPPASPPETDLALEAGRGVCVLVVEDNLDVGRFATQVLDDLGYRSAWVGAAEEALAKLGEDGQGFDIVFSDVVMPGMGGIELAKVLERRFPGLPVVLASGYSHVLVDEGSHGRPLLQKPYSAEQLSRILLETLGKAASAVEGSAAR